MTVLTDGVLHPACMQDSTILDWQKQLKHWLPSPTTMTFSLRWTSSQTPDNSQPSSRRRVSCWSDTDGSDTLSAADYNSVGALDTISLLSVLLPASTQRQRKQVLPCQLGLIYLLIIRNSQRVLVLLCWFRYAAMSCSVWTHFEKLPHTWYFALIESPC